jgi:hypothetical protein
VGVIVTKECTKCKIKKDISNFNSRGGSQKHLYKSRCKECLNDFNQDWRKYNPDKVRVYRAKDKWSFDKRVRRHGITKEEFWNMYESQEGKCAICLQDIAAENSAIDHNHTTGKIRGILCKSCNRGIGLLKDSHEVLSRASDYLLKEGE